MSCAVAVSSGVVFAAATVLGLKYLFIVDSAYLAFIVGSGRFQRMSWQDTLVEGLLLLGSNGATALLLLLLCSLLLQAVRTGSWAHWGTELHSQLVLHLYSCALWAIKYFLLQSCLAV